MAATLEVESTLTDRYQTTVPETVRRALKLGKRDKIHYTIRQDGEVVLTRAKVSEVNDPVLGQFLNFLAKPEIAAEWHQKTGYLPITTAAYDLTREQGFYEKNPGADIATRQMLNKPPLPFTKGLRLGNMPQIRTIVDEELESVWTGKKTPQQALDAAVERGNQLLRRFEQSTKS